MSSSSVNTEHPRTSLGTQPVAEAMESIFLYSGINMYIRSEQQIDFPNSTEETQSNFDAKKKKKAQNELVCLHPKPFNERITVLHKNVLKCTNYSSFKLLLSVIYVVPLFASGMSALLFFVVAVP